MEIRNQIKQAVIDYITLHGYPPTMQEIGQAVGQSCGEVWFSQDKAGILIIY